MDIHNVGGTPGGTRTFLLGMIMAIVGGTIVLWLALALSGKSSNRLP